MRLSDDGSFAILGFAPPYCRSSNPPPLDTTSYVGQARPWQKSGVARGDGASPKPSEAQTVVAAASASASKGIRRMLG